LEETAVVRLLKSVEFGSTSDIDYGKASGDLQNNRMSLKPLPQRPKLEDFKTQAKRLLKALKAEDSSVVQRVRRHHPRLPGRPNTNDRNIVSDTDILKCEFSLADAQQVIAHEHQFESWPGFVRHLEALNQKSSPVVRFEAAVDVIVKGKAAVLKKLLRDHPELARARSTREHRATLLQYVGANAVEDYRQKTPKNAVQIGRILLEAGAEVDADLDYGAAQSRYPERRGSTTLGLVATSCHPAAAGVQIALLELLISHGASIDGLPDGWNPLIAALHNGRGTAAAYLAKRGARLNLEGAAGVGNLEVVKSFFDAHGHLKPTADRDQMELGFIWACEYGRTNVVDFLLKAGMNPEAQPHGETGLHWAAYGGHAATVKLLLSRNAPVEAQDRRFQGTPLGWALYGWCEGAPEFDRKGYYDVVAHLVSAGATIQKEWLSESKRGLPIARKIRADARMRRILRGKMNWQLVLNRAAESAYRK
jgi:ankyrin repeat protein